MQSRVSCPMTRLLVCTTLLVLAGCKLQIHVGQGGVVASTDGAYLCQSGQTCDIDVVDLFFDETFIAVPAPGFYFRNWEQGDKALCAGESEPCHLSTAAFEGVSALESILVSGETFFLEPEFVYQFGKPDKALSLSPRCEGVIVPVLGCVPVCPGDPVIQ